MVSSFTYRFNISQISEEYLTSVRSYISSYARAWNPYFFNYIEGSRSRLTILNISKSYSQFKRLAFFLSQVFAKNGKVLIVNEFGLEELAQDEGMTILNKWIPGILTNKPVYFRLLKNSGFMLQLPAVVFLMKTQLNNVSFLNEARRLRIPSASFTEAHFNHLISDYTSLLRSDRDSSLYYLELFKSLQNEAFQSMVFSYMSKRYALTNFKLYSSSAQKKSRLLRKFRKFKRSFITYFNKYITQRLFKFAKPVLGSFGFKKLKSRATFTFDRKVKNQLVANYLVRIPFGLHMFDFQQLVEQNSVERSRLSSKYNKMLSSTFKGFYKRKKISKINNLKSIRTNLVREYEERKVKAIVKSQRVGLRTILIKPLRSIKTSVVNDGLLYNKVIRSIFKANRFKMNRFIKRGITSKRKGLRLYRRRRILYAKSSLLKRFLLKKKQKIQRLLDKKRRFESFKRKGRLSRVSYYNKRHNKRIGKYVKPRSARRRPSRRNKKNLNKKP
jgi:hypothetical protein